MRTPNSLPRLYLGTMTFGWTQQTSSKVDTNVAYDMVQTFIRHQQQQQSSTTNDNVYYNIDTARIYANGQTEPIVGNVIQRILSESPPGPGGIPWKSQIAIGTKAHPSQVGGLSKEGIQKQLKASFDALNCNDVTKFKEYYLHQPDPQNALLESLQCLNDYCTNDTIEKIGMSNYHVSEMDHAYQLCKINSLPHKPSVYQGLYNPLNRLVEDELIPLLHRNNCSFIAYNPLAGGLLVDHKYTTTTGDITTNDTNTIPPGRFQNNPNYIPRFYTPENFRALQIIQTACRECNITMIEATYRWLLCHSALSGEDGILLGASSTQQLHENLQACSNVTTPLPDQVVKAMDEAWEMTRPTAFPYWRSYSLDMPNREELDPGASYDAAKTKQ